MTIRCVPDWPVRREHESLREWVMRLMREYRNWTPVRWEQQ